MPATITDLVNNITNSVQNLVQQLQGQSSKSVPYPTDQTRVGDVLNKINRAAWNNLPAPYSFAVWNGNSFITDPFSEFQLPLAPGKINQTEHFAIAIKSTQGGTVVSHSGNKYKTLVISGTTGVAPFRGAGGVLKSTGAAIAQPDQLKYKSGFEVFLQLKNYFKAYYEWKSRVKDPDTRSCRLVFKNYKDGEFLIVELLDFQMDRQAPRSFLYDYNLTFKVLGKAVFTPARDTLTDFEKSLQNATEKIDIARGALLRTQDILRQVEGTYDAIILEPLRKISLAMKAFQGVGSTAADVSKQAIQDTMTALGALGVLNAFKAKQTAQSTGASPPNAVLDQITLPNDLKTATANNPAQAVINLKQGLFLLDPTDMPQTTQNEFSQDQTNVQDLPRSFYLNTLNDLIRVKDNAEDLFGLGSPEYDQMFNRTSTVIIDPSTVITDDQFDVLAAFNSAIQGVQSSLSTNEMFKSTWAQQIQNMNDAFADQIDLQALPAVRQVIMPKDTDLERLAQNYLGDLTRWVEIAELNDLRAPFVIQDQSDTTSNVVHPGDNILIPINPTFGFSKLPEGAPITSEQLNQLEKNLGTDLKLTKDFDLSIGNNGDLQIVSGGDNVAQAVVLKLGIEKGELIHNPTIGVGIRVGTKTPDLNQVRNDLIQSLTQDPRIDSVNNLTIRQEAGSLFLTFDLKIRQVDIPVPVNIKV